MNAVSGSEIASTNRSPRSTRSCTRAAPAEPPACSASASRGSRATVTGRKNTPPPSAEISRCPYDSTVIDPAGRNDATSCSTTRLPRFSTLRQRRPAAEPDGGAHPGVVDPRGEPHADPVPPGQPRDHQQLERSAGDVRAGRRRGCRRRGTPARSWRSAAFMNRFMAAGSTKEYDAFSAARTVSAAATSGTTRNIGGDHRRGQLRSARRSRPGAVTATSGCASRRGQAPQHDPGDDAPR